MTRVHRIRLRGPWQVEPLSRLSQGADGRITEQTCSLPQAGVTTTPGESHQTPLGGDYCGRVRYRRRFGRPRQLGVCELVQLVVLPLLAPASVCLNGTPLGRVEPDGPTGRYDITAQLEDRNELWIDVLRQPGQWATRPNPPSGTTTVVCLEIGAADAAGD